MQQQITEEEAPQATTSEGGIMAALESPKIIKITEKNGELKIYEDLSFTYTFSPVG